MAMTKLEKIGIEFVISKLMNARKRFDESNLKNATQAQIDNAWDDATISLDEALELLSKSISDD